MHIQDFWAYVDMRGECWEWQGSANTKGYGQVWLPAHYPGNQMILAHRVAYELVYGTVAPGLYVCHSCDNPSCCRPDHLFSGTPRDNMVDKMRKGRGYTHALGRFAGDRNPNARLDWTVVQEIRSRYHKGNVTQTELAKDYAVQSQMISKIVRYVAWREEQE